MYGPLALLVLAVALFTAGVVRRRVRGPGAARAAPGGLDLDQLQGFVFVGAATLVVLAVGVVVLGLSGREGQAEAAGVLGLIAYLLYLLIAVALIRRTARRAARRAQPWEQPPAWSEQDAG